MRADGRENVRTDPDGLPCDAYGLVLIRFRGQLQGEVSSSRFEFPFGPYGGE